MKVVVVGVDCTAISDTLLVVTSIVPVRVQHISYTFILLILPFGVFLC